MLLQEGGHPGQGQQNKVRCGESHLSQLPKYANLCPIRNMNSLTDVSQVRAFLGCCQQISQYIKGYSTMAAPLHGLTKKARAFPKPWIKGEDYDLSLDPLGISSSIRGISCITKKAMKGYSSKWMQATQGGDHVRTRCLSVGEVSQLTKAGAGKETPVPGKSLSGSARL